MCKGIQSVGVKRMSNFLLLLSFLFSASIVGCTNIIREQASAYYGFVTDSTTGNPIQNAEILQSQGIVVDSSDSAGFYRFSTFGLKVTLTCRATGYQTQAKVGDVAKSGDSLRIDFKLVP
ncbi:MAG: carboxypeptidase-like regulatory domain-containing protein [Candidatus Zixiibacteriota bacterium]